MLRIQTDDKLVRATVKSLKQVINQNFTLFEKIRRAENQRQKRRKDGQKKARLYLSLCDFALCRTLVRRRWQNHTIVLRFSSSASLFDFVKQAESGKRRFLLYLHYSFRIRQNAQIFHKPQRFLCRLFI